MKQNELKVGDRVKIKPSSQYYRIGDIANPINIEGTIDEHYRNSRILPISVKWDNNHINSYSNKDLELIIEQSEFKILSYKNKLTDIVWKLAENGRYYSEESVNIYLTDSQIKSKSKLIHSVMNKDGNTFDVGDEITLLEGVNKGNKFIITGFRMKKDNSTICAITNTHSPNGIGINKIEHFIEKEPEFVLPEKWCIKPNNKKELEIIFKNICKDFGEVKGLDWYYHYPELESRWPGCYASEIARSKEITFEQFKKYVLKEELSPIQLATEEHPELANIDEAIIIAKGHVDQLKLSEQGIKSIVTPNETLLEKAKRLYPVGTKFKNANRDRHDKDEIFTVDNTEFRRFKNLGVHHHNEWLYFKGTWAEIIEEVEPKIGDRFQIIYDHDQITTYPSIYTISEITPGIEGDYQVIKFKQYETQINLSSVLSKNVKFIK